MPHAPPRVLLVMPAGPAASEAQAACHAEGWAVDVAEEPYEGTARFVEQPADLVVLSLARFRPRDVRFIETVRRRAPEARILLVLPEGTRELAVQALEAGADAYVLAPFYRAELLALGRRLLRRPDQAGPDAPAARDRARPAELAHLASEVAHAVNNPLQVLSFHVPDDEAGEAVRQELSRVRRVTDILGRFGHRRPSQAGTARLGELATERLAPWVADGRVALERTPPRIGPEVRIDASQVGQALDDVVETLVALAPEVPVPLDLAAGEGPGGVARAPEASWHVALGVPSQPTHPEVLPALEDQVLWSHEETRRVHPGWALARAVCLDHGGALAVAAEGPATRVVLALGTPAGS